MLVDCNFTVASANGLGITGLKGQGVQNVFMHTSGAPTRGPNGLLNPNPSPGIVMVQLADNFNRYYGGFNGFASPNLTSSTTTVAHVINVISVLGTATRAQWLAAGLPPGIVPALGVAFIPSANVLIGNAGETIQVAAAGSGIGSIEVAGNPNLSLFPVPVGGSPNVGGFLYLSCFAESLAMASYTPAGTVAAPVLTMNSYTPAGTNANDGPPETFTGTPATLTGTVSAPAFTGTPAVLTGVISKVLAAPVDGSVLNLSFYMSQSSVQVAGE